MLKEKRKKRLKVEMAKEKMTFIKKNQKLAIFVKMLISSNINPFSGLYCLA